jgi:UV DNA damage endonuclease
MTHSFDQTIRRLGFCCKYMHPDQTLSKKLLEEAQRPLNTRGTTVSWLNKQTRDAAEQRLMELCLHNIESFRRLIEYVGTLPKNCRMVRLGSDCLPCFTEQSYSYFYRDGDVQRLLAEHFARVGQTARSHDVRISFHPGQFCCLASDRPDVVDRSIDELEYHALMAQWMGYAQQDFDMKINVHLSGKLGAAGFLAALPRLSTELRRCLTLENDEYQAGIDDLLPLAPHVGIVLDIHHHMIHDYEYFTSYDDRITQIQDSWRGVRPCMHYSQPKEEYMVQVDPDVLPTVDDLFKIAPRGKMRSHSHLYHNTAMNVWALSHLHWADIQLEAKGKNLAQAQMHTLARKLRVI